ncbi:exported protein 2, putative [Plasmodium gallinaceum]|uniref:Exported protein 2, putative n=1 Tax=Plasmodium gallinaceum TaxID=5849 RepID=A0A1J1GRK9_PLAGA|nr:exported protein 2, putative [Plasmodium gallinaceum]CRG94909.1 exported protein 2, putative [Plasmodium gallinaceum]
MKISKIFIFSFVFLLYKNNNIAQCEGYGDIAATSAIQTIVKEPISLTIKDLYDHAVKDPVTRLINKIKKVLRYRKVLRWSRIWWILLVREIVGDNSIEKRTEKELREIWDQCTIAVFNNTLNTVETKPLLFLHGILNECKSNFSTKLRQDPSLIVAKMDQIIKSGIYRFWVSDAYLKIGRSGIFYKNITPKLVPALPKEHTLKYLSAYMVDKLKSLESKKNIESGKYEIDIGPDQEDKKDEATEKEDDLDQTVEPDETTNEDDNDETFNEDDINDETTNEDSSSSDLISEDGFDDDLIDGDNVEEGLIDEYNVDELDENEIDGILEGIDDEDNDGETS